MQKTLTTFYSIILMIQDSLKVYVYLNDYLHDMNCTDDKWL